MTEYLRDFVSENLSYKLVSLLITVILWVTVLGRRDYIYTKTVDLNIRVAPQYMVATQTADRVKVRVSGTRAALKALMEHHRSDSIDIDLTQRAQGLVDVDISAHRIELPPGVKLLGIKPNVVRLEIVEKPGGG